MSRATSVSHAEGRIVGHVRALACAASLLAGLAALAAAQERTQTGAPVDSARRAEVAARGARVMPFDLERTLHRFEPDREGGLQTVTARDPADSAQVGLVRGHLREAAGAFANGDFSDPAFTHGDDMPGLAELRAGAERIRIVYEEVPHGARIRYSSFETGLVSALHRWFASQTSDHGRHAVHAAEVGGPGPPERTPPPDL